MSLFKTNLTKDHIKATRVDNMFRGGKKPRKQNKFEDDIVKNIRNLLRLKRKMK